MRRAGRIPYGWITDSTRTGYHVEGYHDAAAYIQAHAAAYRGDLWATSDSYVEVWCESRSIAGVIRQTCRELAVSLYPAGGFASISLLKESTDQIAEEVEAERKPVHIIYIGDYDPAGVLIDVAAEREMRLHLPNDVDLTFHRIAITPEQIKEFDLPEKPRKPGDRRAKHVEKTVEAEALPAASLRGLLRKKVESFLDPGALEIVKVAEESERDGMRLLASFAKGAGGLNSWMKQKVEGRTIPPHQAIEALAREGVWDAAASDQAGFFGEPEDVLRAAIGLKFLALELGYEL